MPNIPFIDTHVHLWNPGGLRYPWLDGIPVLNRPFLLEDFREATQALPIEAIVFVQAEAKPDQAETEAAWVSELAQREPRLKAMVAWAPVENGSVIRESLLRLKCHPILRGIRRIIQFEPDLDFCIGADFIAGVQALEEFSLSFEICIDHRHLSNVVRFAERVPNVPLMLDHIGKPAIRQSRVQPWATQLQELANQPHVWCKISGVATEADHERWKSCDLKRYIDAAIDAFGFERIVFGSDWPVSTQAIEYIKWMEILDDVLSGVSAHENEAFWRGNARRFYGI